MMFNATFINISAISWGSILLVEESEYPAKITDLPQVTNKLEIDQSETRIAYGGHVY